MSASIRPSQLNLRNEGPIGVFDSGLGGLHALAALARRLPHEDFVYLSDTARHPYGTRGKQTIYNYCHACARVLRDHRIKLLVLTSHTASAVAQERLAGELFMPVVGALGSGLQAAVATGAQRIGVLTSTYLSRSGDHKRLAANAGVYAQNSQLLCAFPDDGVWDGELLRLALRQQLAPLLSAKVQTVLLGESPLVALRALASSELAALGGKDIRVVDDVETTVANVAQLVEAKQLATTRTDPGKLRMVFSDPPEDLSIAEHYLGRTLAGIAVSSVDL